MEVSEFWIPHSRCTSSKQCGLLNISPRAPLLHGGPHSSTTCQQFLVAHRPWPIPLQAYRNAPIRPVGARSPRPGSSYHPNGRSKWQNGPRQRPCASRSRKPPPCEFNRAVGSLTSWSGTPRHLPPRSFRCPQSPNAVLVQLKRSQLPSRPCTMAPLTSQRRFFNWHYPQHRHHLERAHVVLCTPTSKLRV